MSNEKKGYEQIKKIAFLGLALGESGMKAIKSETNLGKATAFLSCLDEVIGLLTLDRDELEAEWSDWGEDDKTSLFDELKAHFDLPDDKLEDRVEEYIGIGLDFLDLVDRAISAHHEAGAEK